MNIKICNKMDRTCALLLTAFLVAAGVSSAEANRDYGKYGRKGAKKRKEWLQIPEKQYAPDTQAYCDALWMRVHEADCPMLVLKDKKKTMTLEQADKEGWRIGETGQSGRERCCFKGYRRKYPEADIPEDAPGVVQTIKSGKLKWHLAGCHRFNVNTNHPPMTQKEAEEAGAFVCEHCIERGPSLTTADMEELKKRPAKPVFTPPEDWTPEPFPEDGLPSTNEIEILIQETLAQGYGIQEAPYADPIASLEEFMGRRFFFPVGNWLFFYQSYRATGDDRLLEALRVSARHYNKLCVNYPDVAQLKARDPEHMAFMYSMAVSSRITLQLARKHPDQVSTNEIQEAETFLNSMISALKPTCEGTNSLDSVMGIPQELADDFRTRAFNRAANGIGTLAMASAALEDLQAIRNTTEYQPQIDRYRKCVQEWVKNWKDTGFQETYRGKDYFSYPYRAGNHGSMKSDVKLFDADDKGHFSHTLQGVSLMYDATPELGTDDTFMTAIANTIHFNMSTKSGSPQTPSQEKIRPYNRHPWNSGPGARFYMLEAFKDGTIDAQCTHLSRREKEEVNSSYDKRLKTLHAQYMKAVRKDPSLIYLGENKAEPVVATK